MCLFACFRVCARADVRTLFTWDASLLMASSWRRLISGVPGQLPPPRVPWEGGGWLRGRPSPSRDNNTTHRFRPLCLDPLRLRHTVALKERRLQNRTLNNCCAPLVPKQQQHLYKVHLERSAPLIANYDYRSSKTTTATPYFFTPYFITCWNRTSAHHLSTRTLERCVLRDDVLKYGLNMLWTLDCPPPLCPITWRFICMPLIVLTWPLICTWLGFHSCTLSLCIM